MPIYIGGKFFQVFWSHDLLQLKAKLIETPRVIDSGVLDDDRFSHTFNHQEHFLLFFFCLRLSIYFYLWQFRLLSRFSHTFSVQENLFSNLHTSLHSLTKIANTRHSVTIYQAFLSHNSEFFSTRSIMWITSHIFPLSNLYYNESISPITWIPLHVIRSWSHIDFCNNLARKRNQLMSSMQEKLV